MPQLPEPDRQALEHSERLSALIRGKIADAGGWIPFSDYVRLALYAPGLGYYSAGAAKLGRDGDFVTAPEISSLFGKTLARFASEWLVSNPGMDILELGAGSGKLASDFLVEVGSFSGNYFILEVSADLRKRQEEKLKGFPVTWLSDLPDRFEGIVLANEVLDAVPFDIVCWKEEGIMERGVSVREGRLFWQDRALGEGRLLEAAGMIDVPAPYVSEIQLEAQALVKRIAGLLKKGVLLFIDYGFGRREYYHPERSQGTMMCHYRHHAHDDPFFLPGLQDITTHIDFSSIAEAGVDSGLQLAGYTNQANFLIHCGITEFLDRVSPENPLAYLPLSNELQRLVSPAEMGELFKVMAFCRETVITSSCFSLGDRSRLL
ncbi:MAG TPA: SAM-dependent methyltransferase [Burkholderiales bacterium]|nr:SAM-dependent methyltransferase [Burkholderiales bacterium]